MPQAAYAYFRRAKRRKDSERPTSRPIRLIDRLAEERAMVCDARTPNK